MTWVRRGAGALVGCVIGVAGGAGCATVPLETAAPSAGPAPSPTASESGWDPGPALSEPVPYASYLAAHGSAAPDPAPHEPGARHTARAGAVLPGERCSGGAGAVPAADGGTLWCLDGTWQEPDGTFLAPLPPR
ncbi:MULTISPECIES: hypothetical protein [Streptomyces]|uniref:hypothetical protein n=1 Tax=Streptomyces TaxID=1883 RepID=UPI0022494DC5|nr:hypothetical protein [Streptomyces sp. JHD 1]MCX2968910.1 hypothetical protein [Streptomyces sp. JHD 1]